MGVLKNLMGAILATLAVSAFLAISSPASASTVNLITNGDFDLHLAGWTSAGPGIGSGSDGGTSNTYGAGGDPAAERDYSANYLSQTVATQIGASYTLSFDLATTVYISQLTDHFAAGLDLGSSDAKELLSFTNQAFPDFTSFAVSFTALASSTNISFLMQFLDGYWKLDNVSLTENDIVVTPLPGSAILFMSGLGLIGFVAWRNKRGGFARSMAA